MAKKRHRGQNVSGCGHVLACNQKQGIDGKQPAIGNVYFTKQNKEYLGICCYLPDMDFIDFPWIFS